MRPCELTDDTQALHSKAQSWTSLSSGEVEHRSTESDCSPPPQPANGSKYGSNGGWSPSCYVQRHSIIMFMEPALVAEHRCRGVGLRSTQTVIAQDLMTGPLRAAQ